MKTPMHEHFSGNLNGILGHFSCIRCYLDIPAVDSGIATNPRPRRVSSMSIAGKTVFATPFPIAAKQGKPFGAQD